MTQLHSRHGNRLQDMLLDIRFILLTAGMFDQPSQKQITDIRIGRPLAGLKVERQRQRSARPRRDPRESVVKNLRHFVRSSDRIKRHVSIPPSCMLKKLRTVIVRKRSSCFDGNHSFDGSTSKTRSFSPNLEFLN